MKEESAKEKVGKSLGKDMKTLVSKKNIQVKLRSPSNFLAWIEYIGSLIQKLPESTSDLKILSLIKNSIVNKYDLKEIEEISDVKVVMDYLNSKYLGLPSLLHDSLKPICDAKGLGRKLSASVISSCV